MNDLIIIGASGFGREVAWLVERINRKTPTWNLVGFVDDNSSLHGTIINSYPVLGGCDCLINYSNAYLVCAVGASQTRKQIITQITSMIPHAKFAILIDPTVEYSNLVEIGDGTVICAHTILTVNIKIGCHVILNLGCTVGHDVILEDFVTAYPNVNISGNTNVGMYTEFGTGTQIIQGRTIQSGATVGAGAVVVKDIREAGTYVGVPARRMDMREEFTNCGNLGGG